MPPELLRRWYLEPAVLEEDRHFYDYYEEASAAGAVGTKWTEQVLRIQDRLRSNGVRLEGRRFLDVSGGPGFVAQAMSAIASRSVVTEFSPDAVGGMRRNLGIDAVKFDYNSDRLPTVLDDVFDVVSIDYSINFCDDLRTLASDLLSVTAPDAAVYVSVVVPTLGCCLRWQFDDYTYNNLYPVTVVRRAFEEAGFTVTAEGTDDPFPYDEGWTPRTRLVSEPFAQWYRKRAPEAAGNDLMQRAGYFLCRR